MSIQMKKGEATDLHSRFHEKKYKKLPTWIMGCGQMSRQ
jgi:hypothetical protein